jgi:hypothetical protein
MKIKRMLLLVALLFAAAGAIQTIRQFIPAPLEAPVIQTLEAAFPQDSAVQVDVETPHGSSELLSARELRDQIRDWLLLTVLTNSGLDADKVNEITFDLPPVRYSFMKGVGDWEFGNVRSRALGNGMVVALIPANAGPRRIEYLADIADQNRKNLGRRPERVVVIEYDIDPSLAVARLTRRATLDGDALFTPEYGYVERRITTLDEFKRFHDAVDDLTFAAMRDGALHLGGRRIPQRPVRGIRMEDVAALWQAEQKLTAASEAFEKFVAQKEQELKSRWEYRTYNKYDFAEKARLERELEADRAAVAEEVKAFRKKQGAADSLGFSLDPAYDYQQMADFVEAYLPRLPVDATQAKVQTPRDVLLPDYDELARTLALGGSRPGGRTLPYTEVAAVVKGLRDGSTRLFFEALQKLDGKVGEEFYEECERRYGLQAARYDGDLQYTEPGMVLFYTDLLAKLWAMDYSGAAGRVSIEDFVPLTRVKLSPVYRTELEELRHTRLWFGPQNKGFEITSDHEVLFARVATRLYAASATSLKQGEESAPNAQTASFLGWWDDHYEEVARFEPEYERLNEIMKWSVVLGWLHQNSDLQTLSYFSTVGVARDNWFPDWVRHHSELRFQRWDTIKFFNRGAFGVTTEALPRLRSPSYEQFGEPGNYLVGGVSLASRATIAERPLLSTRVAEGLRRPNIRYTDIIGNEFKTLEGVEYKFAQTANRYEVAIKPDAGMRLRGRVGELANQPIGRTLQVRGGGFEYRALAGDAQIGSLDIARTANGFRVGWASRDLDAGYSLGRRLSASHSMGDALAADSQVMASTRLPDGSYVARVRGSERWVRFAEEQKVSSKIEGEWQARVAGFEPDARSVKMQWVDDAWIQEKLGIDRYTQLDRLARAGQTPGDELANLIDGRAIREAAARISADPIRAHAEMEAAYRGQLAHADDLIDKGSSVQASEHLARMERVWGSTPDIASRRAIALADTKDLGRAARTIEQSNPAPARSVEHVYQELARRIARSASPQDAETWQALRGATEWKASGIGGRPAVIVDGDHLTLEYHMAGAVSKAQPAGVDQAIRSGASVYVQDAPQLRNLDWSVDVQRTMQQAVDGDLAKIIRLPRTDLAYFRPAKIYGPDDTTVLRRVDSPSNAAARAAQTAARSFRSSDCYSADGVYASGNTACPQDGQAVYVIVPKDGDLR